MNRPKRCALYLRVSTDGLQLLDFLELGDPDLSVRKLRTDLDLSTKGPGALGGRW